MGKIRKLKTDDVVLYYNGLSNLELSKVVSIDKSLSQATLANGIKLHRSPDKDNIYHRADYKEKSENREKARRKTAGSLPVSLISSAWLYDDEKVKKWWEAYKFRRIAASKIEKLLYYITQTPIRELFESEEYLNEMLNLKEKFNG